MLLKNEFEVAAPVEKVWRFFENIPQVAACLPGAELTEDLGDGTYKGKVAVRMGPVRLQFAGTADITERDEAAKRVVVHVSGADEKGRGQASMVLTATLDRTGRGTTKVGVVQDLQLSGAAAHYSGGMITDVTTVLMRAFAEKMQGRIERLNLGESAEPAVATAATPAKGFSLGMRAALIALSRVLLRGAHGRASCHDQSLALQIAPARVNLIAAGRADTPPASLPGDQIDERRAQLRTTPPIGRVVGPADNAAPAAHLMTNTAVTGSTFRHRRRPAAHRRMSGGSRAQGDAQLANSERGLASIAGVTATRAASFKTITALRAERPFGAVSTVTQRTETADQNGGDARVGASQDLLRIVT
jgi:carbon monoxide dehydrogenase subunit G